MVPGVHYKEYDVWADVCPPEGEIDAVCAFCLKGCRPGVKPAPPSLEEVSLSDSSSSSVGSASAKRARPTPPASGPSVGPDGVPPEEAS